MKAWAKTVGTVAALGTFAPLALAAAWYALDRNTGSRDRSAEPAAAALQEEGEPANGDGLVLRGVLSSKRGGSAPGPLAVPAASGELTLAAFEGRRMLEPGNVIFVEGGGSPPAVLVADIDSAAGGGGNAPFTIFGSGAGGASPVANGALAGARPLGTLARGAGMISGPSGGGSLQPETIHLLQASGGLGDGGFGPVPGGLSGFGGYDITLQVTPLPPAILAFLSGLAALCAFRRWRGSAGEPAVR